MPKITILPNGMTAGCAPGKNNHLRAKREAVGGWSYSSIRSNTRFLYSIEHPGLTGFGVSITLTVRDCPESHEVWAAARKAFIKRVKRLGLIRNHWLTEWQRRQVPHLHGALWFPQPSRWRDLQKAIENAWLEIMAPYGPLVSSQHVKPMTDAVGWFQYVSKHAARGLSHYQRSPEGIPSGWRGVTGRMWGYGGDWPIREAMSLEMSMPAYHRFRRLVRSWRVANARSSGSCRRIIQAKGMLKCRDYGLSAVRGVSEWIDTNDALKFVEIVASEGYDVEQVWEDDSEKIGVNDGIKARF